MSGGRRKASDGADGCAPAKSEAGDGEKQSPAVEGAPQSFLDGRVLLHGGDCLEVLARLPANSVDAVVTDPPYHLASIVKRFGGKGAKPAASAGPTGVYARAAKGFLGKEWDGGDIAFRPETWAAVLRVLKPGGNLLAFNATRNVHWMAVAIELAGFEVRDRFLELVAADTAVERFLATLSAEQQEAFLRCLDESGFGGELAWVFGSGFPKSLDVAKAIDKAAGHWRGRAGEAAQHDEKRAFGQHYERTDKGEAVTDEARRWSGWGTAVKPAYEPIVWARKPLSEKSVIANLARHGTGAVNIEGCMVPADDLPPSGVRERRGGDVFNGQGLVGSYYYDGSKGRWPANILHDGSEESVAAFPADGAGSAARFFYSAKADSDDRLGSAHPTVKPLDLMQWLVRFACPPGGTVLDPFAGTGTTGEAAFREGVSAVLIEREAEYREDIARRMVLALGSERERRQAVLQRAEERKGRKQDDPGALSLF